MNKNLKDQKLITNSLRSIYGFRTNFVVPKQGKKLDIVTYAKKNSNLSLQAHITQSMNNKQTLKTLQSVLDIKKNIKRIEAYDNSHLSGKNAVGAMVVFSEEGFNKKAYRKFNINQDEVKSSDDYGMMSHILNRRFSKEAINDQKKHNNLPEVILIDGGKGHYDLAKTILKDKKLKDIKVISIYKGENRKSTLDQIIYNDQKGFIKKDSPSYFFIQRLRDESHRFALGAHKAKRKKDMKSSELEPISGLGRYRRKLLLNHFGSIANIKSASSQDLSKVKGISKLLSEKIYDYFNN
tara:strand:- start:213 stop:1097 length:885 start_codon:yes stop_codon:yes gene_type:complete